MQKLTELRSAVLSQKLCACLHLTSLTLYSPPLCLNRVCNRLWSVYMQTSDEPVKWSGSIWTRHHLCSSRALVLHRVSLLSIRRGLSAGRVRGLRPDHLRPLLDAGQRRLLARGVLAVRRVPAAAHRHLLLQRHQTVLQERLPAVRPTSSLHTPSSVWPARPSARRNIREKEMCFLFTHHTVG